MAAESGKPWSSEQPALFAELDEDAMEIYSIGFTQKSASQFFGALKAAGIERLLDVRLNNTSQLAGFAKQADLNTFSRKSAAPRTSTNPSSRPRRRSSTPSRSTREVGTFIPQPILP